MRPVIIFLLYFFSCSFNVNCQILRDSLSQKETLTPRVILKWAPLSLIDIYSSVQFALEYRIGGKSTVQAEAGYIFPIHISESSFRDNYDNMRGYRVRTEYRYYLHIKDRTGGFYVAPEFLFININFDEKDVIQIPMNSFGDFYYQEMRYDVNKTVFGYHLKAGYQVVRDRLVFDFYAGFGSRHVNVQSNAPSDRWVNENSSVYSKDERGKATRISASHGVKLGILLR